MNRQWNEQLSEFAGKVTASEIRELLKVAADPSIISFAGGIPDPHLFPLAEIHDAYERVLRSNSLRFEAFQYSVSEGYLPLRRWIGDHMAGLGAPTPAENILITNGAQQGLDFAAKLLIDRGDAVVVSLPSYLGALQTFSAYGARLVGIPMDEEGMRVEPLEQALQQHPKLVYLVPDFANPSGVTTSTERRIALVTLARRYGVPIIEDSAYARLRYEGSPVPPILAIDAQQSEAGSSPCENVIFLGTFSKVIAPALRVGWTIAPAPLMEKLVLMKQASDLHSSTINQMIMADVAPRAFQSQVDKIIPVYAARRDAMLTAMATRFPASATWTRPAGGMFVWVELPPPIDAAGLLAASLSEAKVAFVPGAAFYPDRSGKNTLRLSFSCVDAEQIERGIGRLGDLLHRALADAEARQPPA